jgi:hypothetical protein
MKKPTNDKQGFRMTDPPVSAISPAERDQIDERIRRKEQKLRKRYAEVHGKRVDWISHWHEEGICFFDVRFTDGKNFSVACHPVIVTDTVELSDMRTGDEIVVRRYYTRPQD